MKNWLLALLMGLVFCTAGCFSKRFYLPSFTGTPFPELYFNLKVAYQIRLSGTAAYNNWEDNTKGSSRYFIFSNGTLEKICENGIKLTFREAIPITQIDRLSLREQNANAGVVVQIKDVNFAVEMMRGIFSFDCAIDVYDTSGVKIAIPAVTFSVPVNVQSARDTILSPIATLISSYIQTTLFNVDRLRKKSYAMANDTINETLLDVSNRHADALYRKSELRTATHHLQSDRPEIIQAFYANPISSINLAFLHRDEIYGDNGAAMEVLQDFARRSILTDLDYICVKWESNDPVAYRSYRFFAVTPDGISFAVGQHYDFTSVPVIRNGRKVWQTNLTAYFIRKNDSSPPLNNFLMVHGSDTIKITAAPDAPNGK